jgi:hypothetical protein
MKCFILFVFLLVVCVINANGECSVSSWTQESYSNTPSSCPQDGQEHGITSRANYAVCWSDNTLTNESIWALGQCLGDVSCTPYFYGPYTESGATKAWFKERIMDRGLYGRKGCWDSGPEAIKGSSHNCPRDVGMCGLSAPTDGEQSANLAPDPSCCSDYEALVCTGGGGTWDRSSCTCNSPIIIDTEGNGFNLTTAANGVLFDIANSGTKKRLSWTAADSDDAFLVLDRNNNGLIDNGRELFGDTALQPALQSGESKNGFRALAIYDKPERGGNDDNQIDSTDAVFSKLMLWRDRNHNGTSEAGELQNLSDSELKIIELDYKESRRKDEHGNWFRYRAKVKDAHGAQVGRWAWDVFLQVAK